ncbi:hypothetical protein ANANG_G00126580 [Anguilla anguilla]|uniref:Secreted protein n=1 Tax=Anguilla anguilla TaxID=7936 RepID=A0A9D3MH62_ANGAN|nr:hypothetical protein ANANG_G00126580 [Anguilla anguilla]
MKSDTELACFLLVLHTWSHLVSPSYPDFTSFDPGLPILLHLPPSSFSKEVERCPEEEGTFSPPLKRLVRRPP